MIRSTRALAIMLVTTSPFLVEEILVENAKQGCMVYLSGTYKN